MADIKRIDDKGKAHSISAEDVHSTDPARLNEVATRLLQEERRGDEHFPGDEARKRVDLHHPLPRRA